MEQSMFCRICLVTDKTMYKLDTKSGDSLGFIYSQLTGIQIRNECHYVCFECATLLKKFHIFKMKSQRAHELLYQISKNPTAVTKEMVKIHIDRKENKLESNLTFAKTICCDLNNGLINIYPVMNKETSNQAGEKLEIEIKPDILFSRNYEEYITQKQRVKEKKLKHEPADHYNDKLPKEEIIDIIYKIYKDKATETNSMLDLIKTSSNDFESDFDCEYLDENILAEVPESVDTSQDNVIEQSNEEKRENVLQKDDNIKVKRRLTRNIYDTVDWWNLEFKGYGNVVTLTPEEVRSEFLMRKDSENYKSSPFKCELCFKGFGRQVTYDNHMKQHMPENGQYECDLCHLRYTKAKTARTHKMHTHLRKFYCLLCPFTSFNMYRGRTHIFFHKGKRYPCTECQEIFTMPNSLKMHKRLKHLNKTDTEFVCDICGDIFGSFNGISVHSAKMHKTDKNSKQGPECEECGVHFDSEKAWSRHLVLSSKHATALPDKNVCKYCGERSTNEVELRSHVFEKHIRSEKPQMPLRFPRDCRWCGEPLSDRKEYEMHMLRMHRGKKLRKTDPYYNLNRPLYFVCEVCGLSFKFNWQLTDHQRAHTGERPFKCDQCDKRYRTKSVLYFHRKNHENENHLCDICGKSYRIKGALRKHMMAHKGIRPHKCMICNKTFPHPCELKTHIKYVHDKVPWPKRIRIRNDTKNRRDKHQKQD